MALGRRPALLFALIYLASLLIEWTVGFGHSYRAGPMLLDADEGEYWSMADAILHGTLQPSARRTLGFPLVLAALRGIDDDIVAAQAAVSALYAFAPPLLFVLVRRLGGSAVAGVVAGLALACWPPAIYYGCSLYSETLAAPVFLAALVAWPPGGRLAAPHARWRTVAAVLAGMLLGLATHVRPMYLLFTPFVVPIAFIEERRPARAARTVALVAAGFLVAILPWSAFQSARFGHPILVTSNGGETLAGGLNPQLIALGSKSSTTAAGRVTWGGPGKWLPPEQTGYLAAAEQALPYDRKDALLRARTRAWALGHPGETLRLELCKLGYMWGIYPLAGNGLMQMLFGNLPTLLLLGVAAWGLACVPGTGRLARLWMLPLFVSGVALISWGSWRFRQPGDAGLLAFAAICVVRYARARAGSGEAGAPALRLASEGAGSAR